MACNGCTKKFGLFLKENGCPSCKYSFCSKCLKYRMKLNDKNRDVCLRCFELSKLENNSKESQNLAQKGTSILDTASTETVQLPEVIKPINPALPQPDADELIRDRLAALKDPPEEDGSTGSNPDAPSSSLTDIEKRLAALKGIEHKDYSEANKKFLMQKDNRTEEEQIRDLMKQFAEEQEIHDSVSGYRLAAIDDIEKRLAALKGGAPEGSGEGQKKSDELPPSDEEEETEEEAAKKLAARFLEEAAIDARNPAKDDDEDVLNNLDIPTPLNPAEVEEELPWCTICNEDAVIRCLSCDGDLFCRGCFKEYHEDDEDYRSHKTKPYKGKSSGDS